MLKIVHLLAGAAALLISLLPLILGNQAALLNADGVALSLIGVASLLFCGQASLRLNAAYAASALLLLALVLQALAVSDVLTTLAGQPTLYASLILTLVATFLQLFANTQAKPRVARQPRPARQAASNSGEGIRETGTVKWFNTSKGFGFISRDSGDDIFVHFRAIRGEGHRVLIEGQRVEYSVMQRDKGLQAEDVIAAAPSRC